MAKKAAAPVPKEETKATPKKSQILSSSVFIAGVDDGTNGHYGPGTEVTPEMEANWNKRMAVIGGKTPLSNYCK